MPRLEHKMRRKLQPHLQKNVTLDSFDAFVGDYIEPVPVLCPEEKAARKRIVEAIAAQYLHGNPPVILSARLRGPFGGGWKNPWAKKDTAQIPSHETFSTDAHETRDDHGQSGEHGIERSPNISMEQSGITEFFSANINQRSPRRTPVDTRTWLRRPQGRIGKNRSEDGDTIAHMSPTLSRHGRQISNKPGASRLTTPILSTLPPQNDSARGQLSRNQPSGWKSSESASMVLTSPVRDPELGRENKRVNTHPNMASPHRITVPLAETRVGTDVTLTPFFTNSPGPAVDKGASPADITLTASDTQIHHTNESVQCGQTDASVLGTIERSTDRLTSESLKGDVAETLESINGVKNSMVSIQVRDADPTMIEGMASAKGLAQHAIHLRQPPSRTAIHQAAERCVPAISTPGLATSKKRRGSDRIGGPKTKKPRPVTFESPDVTDVVRRPRPDVYDVPRDEDALPARRVSAASSRQSNYSTQAALMLAQMEFQNETIGPAASETPGAGKAEQETPRPNIRDPSPTITPFHIFNEELEKRRSPGSVPHVLLSTQELFDAASPFAFSTVKAKPAKSQRSSLRFAVLSNETEERADNEHAVQSPLPSAGRVPLRDRNSRVSFKGGANESEKGSQESPFQLTMPALLPSPRTAQLPLLDFHTSLDDIGLPGGLSFTDRYLKNLEGLT